VWKKRKEKKVRQNYCLSAGVKFVKRSYSGSVPDNHPEGAGERRQNAESTFNNVTKRGCKTKPFRKLSCRCKLRCAIRGTERCKNCVNASNWNTRGGLWVISRFRSDVNEICALLGCYAALSGGSMPTFRDSLSVPSSSSIKLFDFLLLKFHIAVVAKGSCNNTRNICISVAWGALAQPLLPWKSNKYYITACKAHALYYTVICACPALPYFPTLSHKRYDFRKNIIEHKMCVLISSTDFVWKISHSKKKSARYYHKRTQVFM
jgi:hypothetical protein